MKSLIPLIFIAIFAWSTDIKAQSYSADNTFFEETYQKSTSIVESSAYEFQSYLVFDGVQREKNASILSINDNILNGTLLPLSKNKYSAISFNESTIENYRAQIDDENQTIEIIFETELNNIRYYLHIKTMPNGKSFLKINCNTLKTELEYIGSIVRL